MSSGRQDVPVPEGETAWAVTDGAVYGGIVTDTTGDSTTVTVGRDEDGEEDAVTVPHGDIYATLWEAENAVAAATLDGVVVKRTDDAASNRGEYEISTSELDDHGRLVLSKAESEDSLDPTPETLDRWLRQGEFYLPEPLGSGEVRDALDQLTGGRNE